MVLGRFPDYVERARQLGADFFQTPYFMVWQSLRSDAARWALNRAYLDAAIRNGAQFVVTNLPSSGTWLASEVAYLRELDMCSFTREQRRGLCPPVHKVDLGHQKIALVAARDIDASAERLVNGWCRLRAWGPVTPGSSLADQLVSWLELHLRV